MRSYNQYCPVAKTLDLVGDRWTLLVMRELVIGSRRFTDLRAALPGVATNLLAERLRELEDHGLVERRDLPAPAARTVYAATPAGRRLIPVIQAMARFGIEHLPPPVDQHVSPSTAVFGALLPWFDASPMGEGERRWRFDLDGETYWFRVANGRVEPTGGAEAADVTVTGRASAVIDVRQGRRSLRDAVKDEDLRFDGPRRAVKELISALRLERSSPGGRGR